MEAVIRTRGITRRWLLNVLGIVFLVVVACEFAFALFIHDYYYGAIRSQILMSFQFVDTPIDSGRLRDSKALIVVENFADKQLMELQVLDAGGNIERSSLGYGSGERSALPLNGTDLSLDAVVFTAPSGERLMAVTHVYTDPADSHVVLGAARLLVSLGAADRQITQTIGVMILLGVVVLGLAGASGFYFIYSIVRPVREVSMAARKIAMGNFGGRLPVRGANEISELCDTINYMAAELGSAEMMKNEFISSVSHELRTPLTAIKGWAETMSGAEYSDPELIRRGTQIIVSEAGRLSGLVEELLDFSRIQSGHMQYRMQPADVLAALREAVFIFSKNDKDVLIDTQWEEAEAFPPILGDADRLKQVFVNVLDNAVKYTPSGGRVGVTASRQADAVKIRIVDTGCGISAQDLPRVKEKFFKANMTERGSGIGLAVADEIILQHGGTLQIRSKEQIGTAVEITLPIHSQAVKMEISAVKPEKEGNA